MSSAFAGKDMNHITDLVSDYILDLLTPDENREVVAHIASCPVCHSKIMRERQLVSEIRSAIHQASDPKPVRLQELMPEPPKRSPSLFKFQGVKAVGVGLALLTIFLSSLFLELDGKRSSFFQVDPVYATETTTSTNTPISTLTATSENQVITRDVSPDPVPAVPLSAAPHPQLTPESNELER